jgi:hypothetical protein
MKERIGYSVFCLLCVSRLVTSEVSQTARQLTVHSSASSDSNSGEYSSSGGEEIMCQSQYMSGEVELVEHIKCVSG